MGKPMKMRKGAKGVVLLSGGNPQIAKANGDAHGTLSPPPW